MKFLLKVSLKSLALASGVAAVIAGVYKVGIVELPRFSDLMAFQNCLLPDLSLRKNFFLELLSR